MRLQDGDYPGPRVPLPYRPEEGGHLGRVVRIVIIDKQTGPLGEQLEPASYPLEARQQGGQLLDGFLWGICSQEDDGPGSIASRT